MSTSPARMGRLTRVTLHLDRLAANLQLLREEVGHRSIWPVVKADAYGHGARLVARHLESLGCDTLGVADVAEAATLRDEGVGTRIIVLSPTLPEHAEPLLYYDCEPVVCTREMLDALDRAAKRIGRVAAVHVEVDTGMGRVGLAPDQLPAFLEDCRVRPGVRLSGLMSHFACAGDIDKSSALEQIRRFGDVLDAVRGFDVGQRHMANSAALFDLPASHLDAVRPGIALYGLRPSPHMQNPRARGLAPVLEWKTRINFLKEVPAGTGLSYGHTFRTERPSLIATIPAGYADGLRRGLSDRADVLVGGVRCPMVGRVTMDMSLVDVSALRGRVELGDDVVLIGRQGDEEITADEMADTVDTINYEITSAISRRVPRLVATPTL